jgi:hypothetical protein
MFDDLRDQADDTDFQDENDVFSHRSTRSRSQFFLGMTPIQRFVIAVMLFMMASILGTFCLLVTEKVIFP